MESNVIDKSGLFLSRRFEDVANAVNAVRLSLLHTPPDIAYLSANIDAFVELCKKIDCLYVGTKRWHRDFYSRALDVKSKFEENKHLMSIDKLQEEFLHIPFSYVINILKEDFNLGD